MVVIIPFQLTWNIAENHTTHIVQNKHLATGLVVDSLHLEINQSHVAGKLMVGTVGDFTLQSMGRTNHKFPSYRVWAFEAK